MESKRDVRLSDGKLAILDGRRKRRTLTRLGLTRLGLLVAAAILAAVAVPLAPLKAAGPETKPAAKPAKPAASTALPGAGRPAAGIEVSLFAERDSLYVGEPMVLWIRIVNTSDRPLTIPATWITGKYLSLKTASNGKEHIDTFALPASWLGETGRELRQGEAACYPAGHYPYPFSTMAGEFTFEATLQSSGHYPRWNRDTQSTQDVPCWAGKATSSPMTVTVKPLSHPDDIAAWKFMQSETVPEWSAWHSVNLAFGETQADLDKRFFTVLDKFPKSIFAGHCAYALAAECAKLQETSPRRLEEIVRYATVAINANSHYSDDAELLQAEAYLRQVRFNSTEGLETKARRHLEHLLATWPNSDSAPRARDILAELKATDSASRPAATVATPSPPSTSSGPATQGEDWYSTSYGKITNRRELAEAIADLDHADKRMSALANLVALAAPYSGSPSMMLMTGNPEHDAMGREAAAVVGRCRDVETISKALDSPDRWLQWHAIGSFDGSNKPREAWMALLPKLKRLATEDGPWKGSAVERLRGFSMASEFLRKRITVETDPQALMQLMYRGGQENWHPAFCAQLNRLLDSNDAKVRSRTLGFIYGNGTSAPMWQVQFDAAIVDRVVNLTRSKEPGEAALAISTMKKLMQTDAPINSDDWPAWWQANKDRWLCGDLPRWSRPPMGLRARLKASHQLAANQPLQVEIELRSASRTPFVADVGQVVFTEWKLIDSDGKRVACGYGSPPFTPELVTFQPGQVISRKVSPPESPAQVAADTARPGRGRLLKLGGMIWQLRPGKYTLIGEVSIGGRWDSPPMPQDIASWTGQLLMPPVTFEVLSSPAPSATSGPAGSGLATQPASSPSAAANVRADSPKFLVLDLGDNVTMKLAPIPAGKFMMGSPKNEKGRSHNWAGADGVQRPEETEHEVTITKPFHIGIYPVTQRQYEMVMGGNPSYFKGADNPVEGGTWQQAVEFCGKLSAITGRAVRLPTEAQWEYACRAGTKTPFNTGQTITTDQANFDGSYVCGNGFVQAKGGLHRDRTTPAGTFKPNSWGLYDMHGNVWQWCSDWWGEMSARPAVDPCGPATGEEHVMRGGCWAAFAWICRSAYRGGIPAGGRYMGPGGYFGFRVVVADESTLSSGQAALPAAAAASTPSASSGQASSGPSTRPALSELAKKLIAAMPDGWELNSYGNCEAPNRWSGKAGGQWLRLKNDHVQAVLPHPSEPAAFSLWIMPADYVGRLFDSDLPQPGGASLTWVSDKYLLFIEGGLHRDEKAQADLENAFKNLGFKQADKHDITPTAARTLRVVTSRPANKAALPGSGFTVADALGQSAGWRSARQSPTRQS